MGNIAKYIEDGVAQVLLNELSEVGRDIAILDSNDKIFQEYFHLCLTFPTPQKYYVHIHRDFTCPDEYLEGYNRLITKIKSGQEFSAHLSRTTKDSTKHDFMLYDWGIYHFHLGLTKESDGYVQRTSKLLYAYINNVDMYLLGIFEHGQWNNQELIEIIHKYYPWSIKGWLIEGKPERIINQDEERNAFRNAHINTMVTMSDGTSYIGPGLGITAAGTSAKVGMQVVDKFHEFRNIEKELLLKYPEEEILSCKIERRDDDIVLVDSKNYITIYTWKALKARIEQTTL